MSVGGLFSQMAELHDPASLGSPNLKFSFVIEKGLSQRCSKLQQLSEVCVLPCSSDRQFVAHLPEGDQSELIGKQL